MSSCEIQISIKLKDSLLFRHLVFKLVQEPSVITFRSWDNLVGPVGAHHSGAPGIAEIKTLLGLSASSCVKG